MKFPLLKVSCAVALVLFGVSCQAPVTIDEAASSSAAKAKAVSRSVSASGSTWLTDSLASKAIYKYFYSATPDTPVAITEVPLQSYTVSLNMKDDHTFTGVITITSDANSGEPYVPENWKFSTNSASLFPAAWPSSGDRTSFSSSPHSDLPCGFVAGSFYTMADEIPSTVYAIGSAATYNAMPVYAVAYTVLTEVAPVQTVTYSGTWETSESASTPSSGRTLVLTYLTVVDSSLTEEPTKLPSGTVTAVAVNTVADAKTDQTREEFTLTLPNGFQATFFQ